MVAEKSAVWRPGGVAVRAPRGPPRSPCRASRRPHRGRPPPPHRRKGCRGSGGPRRVRASRPRRPRPGGAPAAAGRWPDRHRSAGRGRPGRARTGGRIRRPASPARGWEPGPAPGSGLRRPAPGRHPQPAAGGSAARTLRSCRCRSEPLPAHRARRGAAESSRAGRASAPRSPGLPKSGEAPRRGRARRSCPLRHPAPAAPGWTRRPGQSSAQPIRPGRTEARPANRPRLRERRDAAIRR